VHEGGGGGRLAGSHGAVVDFNRCGTPLMEMVTRPDLRTPEQASRFAAFLRETIVALGVSECDMEKGSLRVDANVSLRRPGVAELTTKTELKNMNSFSYLERGIARELRRQAGLYEAGEPVVTQTLHYDPASDELTVLRSKELAHDYRYFPEPDLVPIEPSAELIEDLRARLPELPAARVRRFERDYALPLAQALDLGVGGGLADYFEEVAATSGDARGAANWVLNEFSAHLNEARTSPADSPVRPAALAALIGLVSDGTLGSSGAKQVFAALVAGESGGDPAAIVQERGLGQIADAGALAAVVAEVVAAHPRQAEQFRSGKENIMGFFVGQVMRATGGRAEPQIAQKLLREELARG
jgi:aspartyl-tRNA(Asn)/glutamyl-tRNA(Gln) amidotransferase subunit B